MWTLKQKENGEVYLNYDRSNRYSNSYRGIWEYVGKQDTVYTDHAVKVNRSQGYICANDDEGNVRVLVLEN